MPVALVQNSSCIGCGQPMWQPDKRLRGWCRSCQPLPMFNGSWRQGEEFDERSVPPNARWWRRHLRHGDQLGYRLTEPDDVTSPVMVELIDLDGQVWPLRSDEIARMRILTTGDELERWGGDITRILPPERVTLDILIALPLPPVPPLRRWRPLTAAGQTAHPDADVNPERSAIGKTWLPR